MNREIIVIIGAVALVVTACRASRHQGGGNVHVVLVGASIGRAWELEGWPARVHADISAESVAAWQFDKSSALEEVLMRPARKFHFTRSYLRSLLEPPRRPQVIILKECSSYFPGDIERYEALIPVWVRQVETAGVRPVLATVVPVTHSRASQSPGKQGTLEQFNDWVREWAASHNVALLDLETALRVDPSDRHLRDEFTSGDGSHLNAKAYSVLDLLLFETLRSAASENVSGSPPI
jgi:hypothetical protein